MREQRIKRHGLPVAGGQEQRGEKEDAIKTATKKIMITDMVVRGVESLTMDARATSTKAGIALRNMEVPRAEVG